MLLRAQNTTLLSKVGRRIFQILWPTQKTKTLICKLKIILGLYFQIFSGYAKEILLRADVISFGLIEEMMCRSIREHSHMTSDFWVADVIFEYSLIKSYL